MHKHQNKIIIIATLLLLLITAIPLQVSAINEEHTVDPSIDLNISIEENQIEKPTKIMPIDLPCQEFLIHMYDVNEEEIAYPVVGGNIYLNKYGGIIRCDDTVTSVNIPSEIEGIPVTGIYFGIFDAHPNLQSVTFADNFESIPSFRDCIKLTSIHLPKNLKYLPDTAFCGCKNLRDINIPNGITVLGPCIFEGCSNLRNVVLSENLLKIEDAAFSDCVNLESIYIPDQVTTIEYQAFRGCSNLRNVVLSENLLKIKDAAFLDCVKLENIHIPDQVTKIGRQAFYGCSNLKYVNIPNNVDRIEEYLFYECTNLQKVILSNNITEIGNGAFSDCNRLDNINLPNSLLNIGNFAFDHCNNLSRIHLPVNTVKIGEGAFYDCINLRNINLPKNLLSIEPFVFYNCKNLERVDIQSGITSIGESAFCGCNNLKKIDIPKSVLKLGDYVFYDCHSLKSIKIPRGVTNIPKAAFYQCYSLKDVSIPKSVTSIGEHAFEFCASLVDISLPNSINSIGREAFCGTFIRDFHLPNKITYIGESLFTNCANLRCISIPKSVTSVGTNAFCGCSNLMYVEYEGSEGQWKSIAMGAYNENLTGSPEYTEGHPRYNLPNILYGTYESGHYGSADKVNLNKRTLIVKINSNINGDESFTVCPGAKVSNGLETLYTDGYGRVNIEIPPNGKILVEKEGYTQRVLSSRQIYGNSTVILQKKSEKPIINAFWIDNVDALHTNLERDPESNEVNSCFADIDWGVSSLKSVVLKQDGTSLELSTGENQINFNQYFDMKKPISIVATNTENITTIDQIYFDETLDFTFSLGDNIAFTLGDDAGPLSGLEINFDGYKGIPVECVRENGKIRIAIGLINADYGSDEKKWEVNNYISICKAIRETSKNQSDIIDKYVNAVSQIKSSGAKVATVEGKTGIDGKAQVMAYAEGYIDNSGHIHIVDSGGFVLTHLGCSYDKFFLVNFVPCFLETKFGADFEADLNLCLNERMKEFKPEVTLAFDLNGDIGLGVGIPKVLSVTGGGKANLNNTANFSNNGLSSYNMKGQLKAYIKLRLGLFEAPMFWDIADKTFIEYPAPVQLFSANQTSSFMDDFYDISQYKLSNLDYLQSGSEFCPNNAIVPFGLNTLTEIPFVSNAYQIADPQTVMFSDGTVLSVWIGYNMAGNGPDALNLYYSYRDVSGVWSEPQLVDNDQTVDMYPCLKLINDVAYLTWQDASNSVGDTPTPQSIAPLMEISAAIFDREQPSFHAQTISHSNSLNMMPDLCGDSQGNIYVVWVNNEKNDWFGQNGENSIFYSLLASNSWGEPKLFLTKLNAITDLASMVNEDGTCRITYCMDEDNNLSTPEDLYVYEDGVKKQQGSGILYSENDLYYWSNGKLIINGNPANEELVLESDNFKIFDGNGVKALIYSKQDGEASKLYVSYYDNALNMWGIPKEFYNNGKYIISFSGYVNLNGEIETLIETQDVITTFANNNPYGQANLAWFKKTQKRNMRLDNVSFQNSSYVKDKYMPIKIDVTNDGDFPMTYFFLTLYDESGTIIKHFLRIDENILSGQTKSIDFEYPITDIVQGEKLKVSIHNMETEETFDDNFKYITLSWNDLSVENAGWGVCENSKNIIYADIVNRGYDIQQNVKVELREDSSTGNVIDTKIIPQINSFEHQNIEFENTFEKDKTFYICIENKENDMNIGNNSSFVLTKNVDGTTNEEMNRKLANAVDEDILSLNVETLGDRPAVEAVRKSYEGLTEEQKKMVNNLNLLKEAEDKINVLQTEAEQIEADMQAVHAVSAQIDLLEVYSLDDRADVEMAREAYEKLTEEQKHRVLNIKVLENAEQEIQILQTKEDQQQAKYVEMLIDMIREVTLNSENQIIEVRKQYDALTDTQKSYVTNIDKLINAEQILSDLKTSAEQIEKDKKAAKEVQDIINMIGEVTLESENQIIEARNQYDTLTDTQKSYVTNIDKLINAEQILSDLKTSAEQIEKDKKAAKEVQDMINMIGEVTLESENQIIEVRKQYDALTDTQKNYVSNIEILINAEERLNELHSQEPSYDGVRAFVSRLYSEILGREADPAGLDAWSDVLKSGKETGAKVSMGFVDSDEFKNKDMREEEFIEIMYRTFLGRPSDEGGLKAWLKVLEDGLSRMYVFRGFVESEEFTKICDEYGIIRGNVDLNAQMDQRENEDTTKFVARCYKVFLGRKGDANGINAWVTQLVTNANNAKQVAHGFVMSTEFQDKNLSNEEYVKTMYIGLMNREADPSGLSAWVQVLEEGKTRLHIFNGFADSPEFRELVKSYGLNNNWISN